MDLSGFAVFDFSEGIPYFSVTSNGVTFNRAVTLKLGTPAFVRLLINESTRQVALQVCDESTPKAVAFYKPRQMASFLCVGTHKIWWQLSNALWNPIYSMDFV